MKIKQLVVAFLILVLLIPAVYFLFQRLGSKANMGGPQMPPPMVVVAQPKVETITNDFEFTGTTAAIEQVEIRARVKGFLDKICFQDGADVSKGEQLFQIEPDIYEAQLSQSQANLQSSQAALASAESDLKRIEEAVKTNAVSQQQLTNAVAARDQAKAAVAAAQAVLAEAKLNLEYTKITAPCDGRISMRYVDEGNLVGAGENTLLADLIKLDPMYVYFYVSEGFLFQNVDSTRVKNVERMKFHVGLQAEEGYPREGLLDYVDNKVTPNTGTVYVRGRLPNPDKKVLPGMFVRIRVPVGTQPNAILVDEKAIGTDIGGKYLLVVDAKNMVKHRPVTLGRKQNAMRVISSGLAADETYIVSGLQFVRPGMEVNPKLGEASGPGPSGAANSTPPKTNRKSL